VGSIYVSNHNLVSWVKLGQYQYDIGLVLTQIMAYVHKFA
jgi:hypothetical protein